MIRAALFPSLFGIFLACTESGTSGAPPIGSGASAGQPGAGGAGGSSGSSASKAGSGNAGGTSSGIAGSGAGGGIVGSGGANGKAGAGGSGSGAGAGRGGSSGRGGVGGVGGSSGTSDPGGAGGSDDGGAGAGNPGGLTSFRLAVIGSSTAAGEGASSSSKGWVSLLAASLEMTVTTEFDASNLAVGGYTTVELLPGSGANGSIDDALDQEPNLVIVALAGSNDLSVGTSTDTFMSRLEEMRDHAQDAGVPVFFVSTAPKDLSDEEQQTLKDWASEMKDRFSSCWAPGRSTDYSPCFIDIFDLLASDSLGIASEYSAGDGVHLNDAGHDVIFEAAREVVTPYVCSMTDCG